MATLESKSEYVQVIGLKNGYLVLVRIGDDEVHTLLLEDRNTALSIAMLMENHRKDFLSWREE